MTLMAAGVPAASTRRTSAKLFCLWLCASLLSLPVGNRATAQTSAAPPNPAGSGLSPAIAPFVIRKIKLTGDPHLASLDEVCAPFIGRLASIDELTKVATAISDRYDRSDVAVHLVEIVGIVPAMGEVVVRVREGFVKRLALTGEIGPRWHAAIERRLAPLLRQQPLRRASFMRTLVLLSDLPGLKIDAVRGPLEEDGGFTLSLSARTEKPSMILGYNNYGSSFTGRDSVEARFRVTDIVGLGDELQIYSAASTDLRRSRYALINYGVPLYQQGWRANIYLGGFRSNIVSGLIRGKGTQFGLAVSRPLIARFGRTLTATLSFEALDLDNVLLGYSLTDDRTRTVRLALGYSQTGPNHQLSGDIVLSQGLSLFGARASEITEKSAFTTARARFAADKALGSSMIGRLRASVQLAGSPLPLAEQMQVGGSEFGRAFESGILVGDDSRAVSVEVARPFSSPKNRWAAELYLFGDAASVHRKRRAPIAAADYRIGSAGMGARLQLSQRMAFDLCFARALHMPYPMTRRWHAFLTARLTLGDLPGGGR